MIIRLTGHGYKQFLYVNFDHVSNFCLDGGGTLITFGAGPSRYATVMESPSEIMVKLGLGNR